MVVHARVDAPAIGFVDTGLLGYSRFGCSARFGAAIKGEFHELLRVRTERGGVPL